MNKQRVAAAAAGAALMAAAAGLLGFLKNAERLGPPAVLVRPVAIYDMTGKMLSTNSVVLPENVPGMASMVGRIDPVEGESLPQDTTYGLRFYKSKEGDFTAQTSVILMGTDHTSIHQPQYCLYGQAWNVTKQERLKVKMSRPAAYDLPVVRMTASKQLPETGAMIGGIYVYWFVSDDQLTTEEGSRLWSMWKSVLGKGKIERWAYISYFSTCQLGEEDATYARMEKLIQASVPDFQLTPRAPAGRPTAMTSNRSGPN